MRVGGATSQLDIPSRMPLFIAGCGRLQLGIPHWATSVITAIIIITEGIDFINLQNVLQVVYN